MPLPGSPHAWRRVLGWGGLGTAPASFHYPLLRVVVVAVGSALL